MKALTAEQAREALIYDPKTGSLTWRKGKNIGRPAGYMVAGGYRGVCINGWKYRGPRVIWLMMTGSWPKHTIDHINHNRLDDRWCNLRDATPAEQNANTRGLPRHAFHKMAGITFRAQTGHWEARICVTGKNKTLGTFDSLDDAVRARRRAAVKWVRKGHPLAHPGNSAL